MENKAFELLGKISPFVWYVHHFKKIKQFILSIYAISHNTSSTYHNIKQKNGGSRMDGAKVNEIKFKIVNKRPNLSSTESRTKRDAVRANLYHIYKKYS